MMLEHEERRHGGADAGAKGAALAVDVRIVHAEMIENLDIQAVGEGLGDGVRRQTARFHVISLEAADERRQRPGKLAGAKTRRIHRFPQPKSYSAIVHRARLPGSADRPVHHETDVAYETQKSDIGLGFVRNVAAFLKIFLD